MNIVRKLLAIVALLLIVCVIAAGALVMFVDPNKLKPVIVSEIQKQSGYQAVIDGKLSWSFYPRLGVKAEHLALTAPGQKQKSIDLTGMTIATSFMQLLRGVELLEGDIRINAITMSHLQAQQARIGVHWKNNVLTLQPITLSLYEGKCNAVAQGQHLSTQPLWAWAADCERVQLKPMFQSLSPNKVTVSGAAQIHFQGETEGKESLQLMRKLNGVATFNVTNGALEGVDLNYFIEAATAFLTKLPVPTSSNGIRQTHFDSMTATAVIKNGVASINNLLLVSPVFATKGSGSIDLVNQKIDYELETTPLRAQKIRWMIPVQITGDLQDPSIRLDTLKLNTILANEQFEKVKTKVRDEIKKLPAKADKLIKHLLGGS